MFDKNNHLCYITSTILILIASLWRLCTLPSFPTTRFPSPFFFSSHFFLFPQGDWVRHSRSGTQGTRTLHWIAFGWSRIPPVKWQMTKDSPLTMLILIILGIEYICWIRRFKVSELWKFNNLPCILRIASTGILMFTTFILQDKISRSSSGIFRFKGKLRCCYKLEWWPLCGHFSIWYITRDRRKFSK